MFFYRRPEEFFRFYRDKMICDTAKPNAAHLKLAELEHAGKVKAIVTQNIDGLHQMAGSVNVLEKIIRRILVTLVVMQRAYARLHQDRKG